jgi:nucleoside-triphosphatase
MKKVYLLTGRPGVGKTSLIKLALAGMIDKAGGFYTEEIRSGGTRLGFRLITLDGDSTTLSHVSIHSQHRVGEYGVDINNLDRIGVSALQKAVREHNLVVIDEIGKMELFSANFKEAVLQIINSGKRVLGTIMLTPNP